MIRIGRTIYDKSGKRTDPDYPGFTQIVVLMKGHSQWASLGPYDLIDEKGRIFENIWQMSKVYEKVPETVQYYSRYNKKKIWDHPSEIHLKDGNLTEQYYDWRKKGMECKYHLRYPVGYHHRNKCLYALKEQEDGSINTKDKLDYVASRKAIYLTEYSRLVKQQPKFLELRERLQAGENLLIIEVDGPHQESLDYYKEKYDVDDDFIVNNTMLATERNIKIMLNDTRHPFGHGYCLAMALLDKDVEWCTDLDDDDDELDVELDQLINEMQ